MMGNNLGKLSLSNKEYYIYSVLFDTKVRCEPQPPQQPQQPQQQQQQHQQQQKQQQQQQQQ